MSRKDSQARHAINRARERYGLYLTVNDLIKLRGMIVAGEGRRVRRLRASDTYVLTHNGVEVLAVYDRRSKNIVTFLDQGTIKSYAV